jgi:uncharacterized metal-binding protein YceD (DUF177 family)
MAPEFSRPFRLTGLPRGGRSLDLAATAAECQALARRFDIPAIASLAASLHVAPLADGSVRVTGQLAAEVTQVCVVSLEPFAQRVEAPVAVRFVPAAIAAEQPEGALDPDDVDEEVFDGDTLELGEMLAQTLSLALDPWPRNPDSDLPPAGDEGQDEGEAPVARSPFAVLARRRR